MCIPAPDMMGVVGPLGKVPRPPRLDAWPRAGTVTPDVGKVIKEYKAGKMEFPHTPGGNIQAVVGEAPASTTPSWPKTSRLHQPRQSNAEPAAVKGQYIKGIAVSATMSPTVRAQA